ncbi:MAG: hypothetical protein C0467_31465 [Planctomycetaceae bacterium]|nr:hypothetical protein [Planctomycetaceae bacterium]
MNASEMIERLKAGRRAEIAQKKLEREAEEAEVAALNAKHIDDAIRKALLPFDELAKCPRTVLDGGRWEKQFPVKHVEFDFPGCLTVLTLRLISRGASGRGELQWEEASRFTGGEYGSWAVEGLDGTFDDFADALIAAEEPREEMASA